jgi:hypothetical protein
MSSSFQLRGALASGSADGSADSGRGARRAVRGLVGRGRQDGAGGTRRVLRSAGPTRRPRVVEQTVAARVRPLNRGWVSREPVNFQTRTADTGVGGAIGVTDPRKRQTR